MIASKEKTSFDFIHPKKYIFEFPFVAIENAMSWSSQSQRWRKHTNKLQVMVWSIPRLALFLCPQVMIIEARLGS